MRAKLFTIPTVLPTVFIPSARTFPLITIANEISLGHYEIPTTGYFDECITNEIDSCLGRWSGGSSRGQMKREIISTRESALSKNMCGGVKAGLSIGSLDGQP